MKSKEEILKRYEIAASDVIAFPSTKYWATSNDALLAMTEFADQETAQLKQEHDRIVKAYDITNKSWVDQMNELSQLRTENERMKTQLAECRKKSVQGGIGL